MFEEYLPYLQHIAYLLLFGSVVAYAALDGFDLGVGCLHLLARNDKERRVFLNAIGPVWDGNSVWIVIATGVLFAGFPKAFASLLSGLYFPVMILIFGFMFRAAAMEFRSKEPQGWWRGMWDLFFFASSMMIAIDLGMIVGALISGVPLDPQGNFLVDDFTFFRPFNLIIGLLTTSLFSMHGAIYLTMKTEGELRVYIRHMTYPLILQFITLWAAATAMTYLLEYHMFARFLDYPVLCLVGLLAIGAIFSVLYWERKRRYGTAFIASTLSIASLVVLVGVGIYPNIITSTIDPEQLSITLYNSSASSKTLSIVTLVAMLGAPLSAFYLIYLYRTFRGHVVIDKTSY